MLNLVRSIRMRVFGHPMGILGRLGGMVMAHTNQRMARRAIEFLDVQPRDKVLEIAFGSGVGIQILAVSASAGWVAGVDLSEEMVEQAQARNAAAIEAGRVALWRGSVDRLPFDDATFDKALSIRSIQVWPDVVAGLREIRRVMRPGGNIVLGCTHHSGQTREGLTEVLTAAGFAGAQVMHADGELYVLGSTPGGNGGAAA